MTEISVRKDDAGTDPCEHRWETVRYTTLSNERRRAPEQWRDDRCALCGESRRVLDPPPAAPV